MRAFLTVALIVILGVFAQSEAAVITDIADKVKDQLSIHRYVTCALDVYKEFAKWYMGDEGIFNMAHSSCRERTSDVKGYFECMYGLLGTEMTMDMYGLLAMYDNCIKTGNIKPE